MTAHAIVLHGAAALALFALSALASAAELDLPSRKAGLWELKMIPETAGAAPQVTMQLCLDAASDRDIMQAGLAMSGTSCSKIDRSQSGDTIVIDATCDIAGRHTVSHTTISGDFQSAYTLKVVSDSEGGSPALPKHTVITQQAKWVGACAAGMAPGDMMMPGGHKVNVLGVLKKPGG
jgi:hypothetical protein